MAKPTGNMFVSDDLTERTQSVAYRKEWKSCDIRDDSGPSPHSVGDVYIEFDEIWEQARTPSAWRKMVARMPTGIKYMYLKAIDRRDVCGSDTISFRLLPHGDLVIVMERVP